MSIPDLCTLCNDDVHVAAIPLLDRPEAVMGCYACLGHDVTLRAPYASHTQWRSALEEFEEGGSSHWPPEVTKELREQEEQQTPEAESEREEATARKAEEIADERAKRWFVNGVIVALIIVVASMCARGEGAVTPTGRTVSGWEARTSAGEPQPEITDRHRRGEFFGELVTVEMRAHQYQARRPARPGGVAGISQETSRPARIGRVLSAGSGDRSGCAAPQTVQQAPRLRRGLAVRKVRGFGERLGRHTGQGPGVGGPDDRRGHRHQQPVVHVGTDHPKPLPVRDQGAEPVEPQASVGAPDGGVGEGQVLGVVAQVSGEGG